MARIFVSTPGRLRERWSQAFPDARVVPVIANGNASIGKSLWLDLSAIPTDSKLEHVTKASSAGLAWTSSTSPSQFSALRIACPVPTATTKTSIPVAS